VGEEGNLRLKVGGTCARFGLQFWVGGRGIEAAVQRLFVVLGFGVGDGCETLGGGSRGRFLGSPGAFDVIEVKRLQQ